MTVSQEIAMQPMRTQVYDVTSRLVPQGITLSSTMGLACRMS